MPIDFIEDEAQAPAIDFQPDVDQAPQIEQQGEPDLRKSIIPDFLLPQQRIPTLSPEQIAAQEKPLVNIPEIAYQIGPQYLSGMPEPIAKGLARAAKANIEGLTSPESLAMTVAAVAAPAIAGPAIAAQMVPGIYQSAKQLPQTLSSGDIAAITEQLANLGVGGAIALGGGAAPFLRRPIEGRALPYPPGATPDEAAVLRASVPQDIVAPPKIAAVEQAARRAAIKAARPEVPVTAPEPERALTVIQEIRAAGADTKEKIRALYPQLTREEAAALRRQAYPEGGPSASRIREDEGQVSPTGDVVESRQGQGGEDLEREPSGKPGDTGAPQPQEAPGQPDVRVTPVASVEDIPATENGGRIAIILPNGKAVVGGRIHADTWNKALEAGVATDAELSDGFAGFVKPDGTAWGVNGAPLKPVSEVFVVGKAQPKPPALPSQRPPAPTTQEPQWFNHPLSFWKKYTRPVTASKMPEDVRSALVKFTKIDDTPKAIADFLKKRVKEVEEQVKPPEPPKEVTPSEPKAQEETQGLLKSIPDSEVAKIAAGDKIRWEPNENERRYQGAVEGLVQDVIHNSDGEVGYHIFAPREGDPHNVVRVWANRGKVVSREPAKVEPSTSGMPEHPSTGVGEGRTPNRPKTVVEIADEIAARGVDPQASYGLFVKARNLKPEIDAKDWLPIYRRSLELANLKRQIRVSQTPESKPAPPPAGQAPPSEAPTAAAVSPAEPTGVTAPAVPPAIPKSSISEATGQGGAPKKTFREVVAESKALQAKAKQYANEQIAAASKGDAVKMTNTADPTKYVVVAADPTEPGKWRATRFDAQGPSGHDVFSSKDNAVRYYSGGQRVEGQPPWGKSGEYKVSAIGKKKAAASPTSQAPKPRGVERPPDIIDVIKERIGTIRGKGSAKAGSEGYYTPEFVALSKSGASRELFSKTGQSPDEVLDTLRREGFFGQDATVDDLTEAISKANAQRRAIFRGETPEIQAGKFQAALKKQGSKTTSHVISVGDLGVGDKFRIQGEDLEVVSIDPDTGEVTVKDGRKFGYQTIPDGADLPIEKGSLAAKAKVPVFTKEDFALNAPESIEEQKARLAHEAELAKQKAERDQIEEQSKKPLIGSVGDIGQGDWLGGGDLFSIGPGAAAAGEPGKYSAIEQLSDQLRTVPSSAKADPLPWRERMADKLTIGKTALAKVVGRMRAVTESVKDAASGMRDINDLERTIGVFDRDVQSSIIESDNLKRVMPRQYKNETMRRAAALFIDAGGDQAQLRAALADLPKNTPIWLRKAVEMAADLPDDAKPLVDFLRQFYGVREGEAIGHDIFEEGLPDYFTHIWKREANMPDKLRMALTTGNVNTYWQFARHRKLSTFLEGIMQGKVPELDPAKVIPFYNYTLDRALASRALIRQLSDLKASDGRDVLAPAGTATRVPKGSAYEVTFIKPRAYQGDYRSIDHPALRKWKWASKDENGNPVFYQADLRVHPEVYERMARMMERSRLTPTPKMKAALRIGSELKAAKFGLASTFHQLHVGLHAAFHWTDPLMLSKKPWVNSDGSISASHPFVQDAIQYGHLKLAAEPWEILNMSEGILGHGSLIQKIPLVGPWSRVYSEWLFSRYIPKLKLATYENALPRNLKAYEGKYTPEQIKARTGDAVNNAFGELNRLFLGKYGRDPQFQRQLRLMFLAPDFGEARLRFAAKALTKGGHEERLALATMFVTLYTAARIGNYMTSGDPRWTDWEHLFAVKTKDKYFSMRSVLGDLDHAYDDFRNFAVVRLSPFTRTLQEVIWGRDERGRKRTGSEIVGDVMRQAVPISLQGLAASDRKFLDDFSTAMGVTTRRDNPEMDIHQLARDWQAASKDPKVQAQYQRAIRETPMPSEYAKLRAALRDNDREAAQKEYRKLRAIKTRAQVLQALQPAKPVTGSWPNERLFVQSLTPRQRQMYQRAMQERRQMYQRSLTLGQ